jgi:dienelactone hydrolase
LYHHAQGLTAGVREFADELRSHGHRVTTPDLYGGHVFATLDEGLGYAQDAGWPAIHERGVRAARELPNAIVYAGFSLGVMPAQHLAQTRPGARGALLFHSCLPVSENGETWPEGVPVQIHAKESDPFWTEDGDAVAAQALVASTHDAELFTYPGDQHLFADSSLPGYDQEAAALLTNRVLGFLAKI